MTGTLVVHPGALGDVLLAVPALRALRYAHEGEALTLAAQPRIAALLRELGVVDAAMDFDSLGLDALFVDEPPRDRVRVLSEAQRVVCWFGASDAGFVGRLKGLARDAVVAPPAVRDGLVWQHLVATVGMRTGLTDVTRKSVDVSLALMNDGRAALCAAGWDGERSLLMVHPGAGGVAKRWPIDGFVNVIEQLQETHAFAPVVHEGPADHEAAGALLDRLGGTALSLDHPPLPVLAGALGHVTAYIGNDSGVSHLAAGVGTRAVVLFTSGNLPWVPWSLTAESVTVSTTSLEPRDIERVGAALARMWRT